MQFVIYVVQKEFDLKSIRGKYCFKCLDSINYPTQKFSSTHEIKVKGKRKKQTVYSLISYWLLGSTLFIWFQLKRRNIMVWMTIFGISWNWYFTLINIENMSSECWLKYSKMFLSIKIPQTSQKMHYSISENHSTSIIFLVGFFFYLLTWVYIFVASNQIPSTFMRCYFRNLPKQYVQLISI